MPDVKDVIKGLLCCINNERATPDCMRCPYAEINGICIGLHKLHGDALALLQAQEPMVITMEEAAQADYCYVEYKSGDVEPVLVNSYCDGNYRLQRKDAYHVVGPDTFAPYGRFWTSRPTDEQREATPWE